jgi:hypothetical protein
MEQLSIASFLANGHPYHLYTYDDLTGIPNGTELRDASRVLPASAIFEYCDYKSYSGFSNWFRYELLFRNGGWWCDLDVVCLRPFRFRADYVFSSEHSAHGGETLASGVIKAPAKSQLMKSLSNVCRSKDRTCIRWGETGPSLLHDAVRRSGLERHVRPAIAFNPVPYYQWPLLLSNDASNLFGRASYSVHLWHELWRRTGVNKDASFSPESCYEQLKRKYLTTNG